MNASTHHAIPMVGDRPAPEADLTVTPPDKCRHGFGALVHQKIVGGVDRFNRQYQKKGWKSKQRPCARVPATHGAFPLNLTYGPNKASSSAKQVSNWNRSLTAPTICTEHFKSHVHPAIEYIIPVRCVVVGLSRTRDAQARGSIRTSSSNTTSQDRHCCGCIPQGGWNFPMSD